MSRYALAFLIGGVAGLRSMTAPAVVSLAARRGWLHLENSSLAFMGSARAPSVLSALAISELAADKLPQTQSRKAPAPFATRIASGALSGAELVAPGRAMLGGLVAGAAGAIVGTLGGYEVRKRATKAIGGRDLPVALIEDAIAIGGAFWIVSRRA